MFDTVVNFLIEAGKIGGIAFGVIVLSFLNVFIVVTGLMFIFWLFKQVFMPNQKKIEPLHYTLLKNLALPFIMSMVKDVSNAVNEKLEKKSEKKKD